MRRLLFLLPALAMCQVTPEVTTNIQLENFVFYMHQHGDATKIGTLPGPAPVAQLGSALRRYAIIADIVLVGGKLAEQVIPQDLVRPVPIPIEALVNGASAEVVNAIGWPGFLDHYRADIRVPPGVAPGTAKLLVNGAYLPSRGFQSSVAVTPFCLQMFKENV